MGFRPVTEWNRTSVGGSGRFSSAIDLGWLSDEDDRTLHIGRDDALRPESAWVTKTGINSIGTESSPLIKHVFDVFGGVGGVEIKAASSGATRTTTATYDKNGRPTSMVYPKAGGTTTIIGDEGVSYDEIGNVLWARDGNGRYTLYHYDDLHRLDAVGYTMTQPQSAWDGSNPDIGVSYEGNTRLVAEMTDNTGTTSFEYDPRGRLSTYDPPGDAEVTYSYNNLDQVTSITSGGYNVQYKYFANGLLDKVTTENGAKTLASYIYDQAGVLQTIAYGNTSSCSFAYVADDPRYPWRRGRPTCHTGNTRSKEERFRRSWDR